MARRILTGVAVAVAVAVWAVILAGPPWWTLTDTAPEPCPPAAADTYDYGWEPC